MASDMKRANEAWETLFRAQATIAREFTNAETWGDLIPREYSVLYALSTAPDGLRITELGNDVLLTQPGISRLVGRLEDRGLIERTDDPDDTRACRIRLTPEGVETQRRLGTAHARHVTQAMTRALNPDQIETLRGLCQRLLTAAEDAAAGTSASAASSPRSHNTPK